MPIKIHFSVLINFQHFIPSSMSALFYFPVCMSAWYDWGNSSQPQCLRTTQPKDSCKSFSKRAEMFSVRFPTSFCQVKSSKSWIQNSKIIALFSHIGLCKPLHIFWNIISPQMIGYDMSTLRTWREQKVYLLISAFHGLSFLVRLFVCRPAMVTSDQISTFFNIYRHKSPVIT